MDPKAKSRGNATFFRQVYASGMDVQRLKVGIRFSIVVSFWSFPQLEKFHSQLFAWPHTEFQLFPRAIENLPTSHFWHTCSRLPTLLHYNKRSCCSAVSSLPAKRDFVRVSIKGWFLSQWPELPDQPSLTYVPGNVQGNNGVRRNINHITHVAQTDPQLRS